jgi:stage V sporulation protein AC
MSREIDKKQAQAYKERVKALAPKSNTVAHCVKAFLVGGLICAIGQGVSDIGKCLCKLPKESLSSFTAIIMVILGATLTGIGVYDRIGKFAGAGSIIPITGFANSVVAPAMEFRSEGFVMGTGAKLFQLAGPVLVNGYSVSVIIGIILFIMKLSGGLG